MISLATTLVYAAAESEEHGNVAMETIGYGFIALIVFAALGLVTLSYRNVANRHSGKAAAYAAARGKSDHDAGANDPVG